MLCRINIFTLMSSASVSGTGTSAADSAKRDSSNVSNHCDGEVQRSEGEDPSLYHKQNYLV